MDSFELSWYSYKDTSNCNDRLYAQFPDMSKNFIDFKVSKLTNDELLSKTHKECNILQKEFHAKMLVKRLYNLTTKTYFDQGTKEWLKEREKCISASDAGTALGMNKYSNCKELILKKCNRGPKFTGNKFTDHGHKYEDVAAQLYQTMNLQELYFFGLVLHKDENVPIGASPDGIRADGVMLEIKVPYCRVPNGIVPPHYEVQTQVQMEVCEFYENDFYECQISEYDTEEEYVMDGFDRQTQDGKIKGMIGQFYHVLTGKNLFVYPPMWCTSSESETWITNKIKGVEKDDNYRFDCIIYWKQEIESCVRVYRDEKRMHNEYFPVFKDVWSKILYHRGNGGIELDADCLDSGEDEEEQVTIEGFAFGDDSDSD
jgi:putative phage-type endonuclease